MWPSLLLGLSSLLTTVGLVWWIRDRAVQLEIVDLRHLAPASKRSKRTRPVDAVVLHQMGFSRGSDLSRYHKVTAHFVIMPDGRVGQLHPLSARLPASNGFNARSVAVEFAGNLKAANGNWWNPDTHGRNTLTNEQIESGRRLLELLRRLGIRFVFAHRQSAANRGNCPGPEVWGSVGQWGIAELGLDDGGSTYAIDDGKPIPDAWRTWTTA